MNKIATELIQKSENWLRHDVLPLWSEFGFDPKTGGFVEAMSTSGKPLPNPRRALVQARQIYSFLTASKLKLIDEKKAHSLVVSGINYLIKNYQQPSGAFVHSINLDGSIHNGDTDLYTQAFALFALGCAYELTKDNNYRDQAIKLTNYLNSNRPALNGGYTEIKNHTFYYQSNPHMHLFEAALLWLENDPCDEWKTLAFDLCRLANTTFFDAKTETLCEHFTEGWEKEKTNEKPTCFIFEPGHHYEWAWLFAWHQKLSRFDTRGIRHGLYSTAETYGVNRDNLAVDEVYSDYSIRKSSSRFWPQCERIKAAVQLGLESPHAAQPVFAQAADDALTALFGYFNLPTKGLWQDVILETGEFSKQDPKGSSLYHIINAMYEYIKIRPQLHDGLK